MTREENDFWWDETDEDDNTDADAGKKAWLVFVIGNEDDVTCIEDVFDEEEDDKKGDGDNGDGEDAVDL